MNHLWSPWVVKSALILVKTDILEYKISCFFMLCDLRNLQCWISHFNQVSPRTVIQNGAEHPRKHLHFTRQSCPIRKPLGLDWIELLNSIKHSLKELIRLSKRGPLNSSQDKKRETFFNGQNIWSMPLRFVSVSCFLAIILSKGLQAIK